MKRRKTVKRTKLVGQERQSETIKGKDQHTETILAIESYNTLKMNKTVLLAIFSVIQSCIGKR